MTATVPRLQAKPAVWVDSIVARVGCYGIGQWLQGLGRWCGFDSDLWLPDPEEAKRVTVPVPARGLQLQLRALDTFAAVARQHRIQHIALEGVVFNAAIVSANPDRCALPWALDSDDQPEQATARLRCDDTTRVRQHDTLFQSWFLDDGRVVEGRYDARGAELRLSHLALVRLGDAEAFGK